MPREDTEERRPRGHGGRDQSDAAVSQGRLGSASSAQTLQSAWPRDSWVSGFSLETGGAPPCQAPQGTETRSLSLAVVCPSAELRALAISSPDPSGPDMGGPDGLWASWPTRDPCAWPLGGVTRKLCACTPSPLRKTVPFPLWAARPTDLALPHLLSSLGPITRKPPPSAHRSPPVCEGSSHSDARLLASVCGASAQLQRLDRGRVGSKAHLALVGKAVPLTCRRGRSGFQRAHSPTCPLPVASLGRVVSRCREKLCVSPLPHAWYPVRTG